jgi:HNH endonuclease
MWGGRCWMCGGQATATDHVKALVCGGSNWPANLRPICQPCNSRKGAGSYVSSRARLIPEELRHDPVPLMAADVGGDGHELQLAAPRPPPGRAAPAGARVTSKRTTAGHELARTVESTDSAQSSCCRTYCRHSQLTSRTSASGWKGGRPESTCRREGAQQGNPPWRPQPSDTLTSRSPQKDVDHLNRTVQHGLSVEQAKEACPLSNRSIASWARVRCWQRSRIDPSQRAGAAGFRTSPKSGCVGEAVSLDDLGESLG